MTAFETAPRDDFASVQLLLITPKHEVVRIRRANSLHYQIPEEKREYTQSTKETEFGTARRGCLEMFGIAANVKLLGYLTQEGSTPVALCLGTIKAEDILLGHCEGPDRIVDTEFTQIHTYYSKLRDINLMVEEKLRAVVDPYLEKM